MEQYILQLTAAVLLLSNLLNANTPVQTKSSEVQEAITAPAVVLSTISSLPHTPLILQKIGDCESGDRDKYGRAIPGTAKQLNEDGSVVRGKENPQDVGKYQINLYWNGETAKNLGYDLFTEEGNTKMALYLYETRGTRDWGWSAGCWSKS